MTQASRVPGYHRQWQQSRMQLTSYCSNWTRNTGKTAKDSILLIRTRCHWCPGLHRRLVDWFVFLPVFLPQKIFVRLPSAPLQRLCRSQTRLLLPEFLRLVFDDKKERTMTVCHVLVSAPCPLGARSAVILLIAHGVPLEDYCHWPSFSLGSSGLATCNKEQITHLYPFRLFFAFFVRCTMVFLATSSQVAILISQVYGILRPRTGPPGIVQQVCPPARDGTLLRPYCGYLT